jgi:hypothetical protein
MKINYLLQPTAANENLYGRETTDFPAAQLLSGLRALDVLGFQSFVTDNHLEQNVFTLIQGLKPRADDGRMVYEHVLAGILRNKPKPLFIVEPLHFATGHNCS